jgi:F420-dependent oxidoreductase-like protein
MQLGMNIGGRDAAALCDLARRAESLGLDSLWRGEAYGGDAIVPLAMAAAVTERIKLGTSIMQMPARTPTMTAMTAMQLDELTGGRVILGLGMSGPQVVEGWHGVAYGKPLGTTEEYVAIVRKIFAGDERVSFAGDRYRIPYDGDDASGLGKALRPGLHTRADIPIYLAAIGPKNVALSAEIADGWLPTFYSPAHAAMFDAYLDEGFARGGGSRAAFDVAPMVSVVVGDDVRTCRDIVKPFLALYIGGMGARGRNFYKDLVTRYGHEEAAATVQSLYLEGRKGEAAGAIPDALVDDVALVGPKERIAERLSIWRDAGVDTLIAATWQVEALEALAAAV